MKKIILFATLLLIGLAAQAQGTVIYTNEAEWEAVSDSNATLRVEDFSGGPSFSSTCGQTISSESDNCFPTGELEPYFIISSNLSETLSYLTPTFLAPSQTKPVITSQIVLNGDFLRVDFDTSVENISRISFKIFPINGLNSSTSIIRVYDTMGTLITTFNQSLTLDEYNFVGIQSTTAIGGVEIEDDLGNTSLTMTDLKYGITRVNDDGGIVINVGADFEEFDTVGSTIFATDTSVFSNSVIDPTCASYNGSDVFFGAIVPSNGAITIETQQEPGSQMTDTGMEVYDSNFVPLACDDDGGSGTYSLIALDNLTPGDLVFIRVWAFGNTQNGTFKISAYNELLSTSENAIATMAAFPNPTKEIVTIKADAAIQSIEVMNILGQKIFSIANAGTQTQIDLSNQPAGVYIANVVTETGRESIKLVKE